MKIRVAIFDQDQEYQSRLAETLQKNYPEKLEVFTCSSVESIPDTVSQNDVQLLAVSQGTELDVTQLQDKCAVVSLVETKVNKEITADNIFDVPEVGRYQSINDIARALYVYGNSYKDIFEIKKEADNVEKQKEVKNSKKNKERQKDLKQRERQQRKLQDLKQRDLRLKEKQQKKKRQQKKQDSKQNVQRLKQRKELLKKDLDKEEVIRIYMLLCRHFQEMERLL